MLVSGRARGYDFIIVGGGSSGCVAASRLVGEHGARVLVIEAGPSTVTRSSARPPAT